MNTSFTNFQSMPKGFYCLTVLLLILSIYGCATGGKPPYEIKNYLLTYPPPSMVKPERLNATLKFNRFSIATAYNSTHMIFRKDEFGMDTFNYSRWAVNPADMIADSLLRDLRDSGLFHAVFSRHDTDEGRFVISGNVEEFFLRLDRKNAAVVGITISLKDTLEKETPQKIILQKKYSMEELLQDNSPYGYSQAASQAMRTISQQIMDDIYTAIRKKI
jgi:ABC-type uncharacterized transport system auxiliary subunit